jgi:hypothetical protein
VLGSKSRSREIDKSNFLEKCVYPILNNRQIQSTRVCYAMDQHISNMKTVKNKSSPLANILVSVISTIWIWLLTSNAILKIGQLRLVIVIAAYTLSCAGLISLARTRAKLNLLSQSACIFVASLITFMAWSYIITAVSPSVLTASMPDVPKFVILVLPAIVSIFGVVAVLLLPIALLSTRARWIVPISATVFAVLAQLDLLSGPKGSQLSIYVTVFEFVCLGLFVPFILGRLEPKVRRAIEDVI